MIETTFYRPEETRPPYAEIIPVYQAAFTAEPWNEVSKCVDLRRRCVGGMSATALGETCGTCGLRPVRPAYEPAELTDRFDTLATTRPTVWYTERSRRGLAMAAVAWRAPAKAIAVEKYADVPAIGEWLDETLGDEQIIWLDEVFADRSVRPAGNLRNFGQFINGFRDLLGTPVVAYRTIEPRMTAVPLRDFSDQAAVFTREDTVPDRRDFVVIGRKGSQS